MAKLPEGAKIESMPGLPEGAVIERLGTGPSWKQTLSNIARPFLVGGAMTGGGLVGSGLGPLGTLAGGTLGYAGGEQAADLLDIGLGLQEPPTVTEGLKGAGEDLRLGAMYEMGGGIANVAIFKPVFKAGKWTFNQAKKLSLTKLRAEKDAQNILRAHTSSGDIYAQNADEAAALEKEIPGLKFTRGQQTADARAIMLERSQFRRGGEAAELQSELTASNDQALREYYARNFPTEKGVDDYISSVQGRQSQLLEQQAKAGERVQTEMVKLRQAGPQQTGKQVVATLRAQKNAVRESASKLYEAIPEAKMDVTDLTATAKEIAKARKFEQPGGIPHPLKKYLTIYGKKDAPQAMNFGELRELRSDVLSMMREEAGAAKPNLRKLGRLGKFENALDDAIDQLGNEALYGDDTVEAYRTASKAWKLYKETYEKGTIGQVLRRGPMGESTRMAESQIAGTFWNAGKPEAVDDLISALGGEGQARAAMRDYANYDLLQRTVNPSTGSIETTRLSKWIHQNRPLLKKLGLEGEYSDLQSAVVAVEKAKEMSVAFERSAAARVLGADPEKAISVAFAGRGSKDSARVAKEMLDVVKGDPAAEAGVKKAFVDNIIETAKTTAKDIEGNPVISLANLSRLTKQFMPAMRVFYKNEPGKIKALQNIHRSYEVLMRNTRSPIGGGSDSAENIAHVVAQIGGPLLSKRYAVITTFRMLATLHRNFRQKQIDAILTRAVFDPEYAQTVMMMSRGAEPQVVIKRFTEHLTALGLYGAMREQGE